MTKIPYIRRLEIFRRDNYTCYLCGRWIIFGSLDKFRKHKHENNFTNALTVSDFKKLKKDGKHIGTVDHVIARSNGGSSEDINLKTCCCDCNQKKGAKSAIVHNILYIHNIPNYVFIPNESLETDRLEAMKKLENVDEVLNGEGFHRELMDRSWMMSENVHTFLMEQALCICDPEFYRLASEAHEKLIELYSAVGQRLGDQFIRPAAKESDNGQVPEN